MTSISGDSLVLTSQGYLRIDTLVGESIMIWDGTSWIDCTPKENGIYTDTLVISTSSGSKITCSTTSIVPINIAPRRYNLLSIRELTDNKNIHKIEYPIIDEVNIEEENQFYPYAYTHGIFTADGTYSNNLPYIVLYDQKECLSEFMNTRIGPRRTTNNGMIYGLHYDMPM
jgi:hypothetical protein